MGIRCESGLDMEKVAKCSFLKRAFVLLPLLLVCACTTTIKPVGTMPIASSVAASGKRHRPAA